MLKENLMSILAALGEVQGNTKNEEQAARRFSRQPPSRRKRWKTICMW